jgi:hypothetical protein
MSVGASPPPLPKILLFPYDMVVPEIDDVLNEISELASVTVPTAKTP